jgi:integrase
MRPGELLALKWDDVDLNANRIRILRRIYEGEPDVPKSGIRTISLTPPARDAIRSLSRDSDLVFTLEGGAPMTSNKLSRYWNQVQDAAGLKFAFYHATKHYGVHYMWAELKMPLRAIAAQAGWRLETAVEMLAIYGHPEIGVLEDVDSAFRFHDDFPGGDLEGLGEDSRYEDELIGGDVDDWLETWTP